MFGINFGGSSTKTKGTTYIDGRTSDAQWGNWGQAQGITPEYSPVTAQDIGGYFSPFENEVVQANQNDIERSRQMAVNGTGDTAAKVGAFGGSRHGVAEALTNDDYARAAAQMSATLRNAGWGQALDAASQQKQLQYMYPLQRQQTLNQTLAGITPQTFTKGKGTTFSGNISGKWGS
jgi:hypothetical protein